MKDATLHVEEPLLRQRDLLPLPHFIPEVALETMVTPVELGCLKVPTGVRSDVTRTFAGQMRRLVQSTAWRAFLLLSKELRQKCRAKQWAAS